MTTYDNLERNGEPRNDQEKHMHGEEAGEKRQFVTQKRYSHRQAGSSHLVFELCRGHTNWFAASPLSLLK